MPYMELRNYRPATNFTVEQRDKVMQIVRNHLARGQEIDGTFEFHYMDNKTELDRCEYEYILVIDMGWSEDREARKEELARALGADLAPVLGTDSFAVRLRLQNAGFVPYQKSLST